MDDITKRQIEKEIEDFITNLFEKHQDLHKIQLHKMMRAVEPKTPHRHTTFEIYRRHMSEDEPYKVDYNVVEYNDVTKRELQTI